MDELCNAFSSMRATNVIDLAWAGFDSFKPITEDEPEYFHVESDNICSCGGVISFDFDLPTCTSCGLCEENHIPNEPEWRSGANTDGGSQADPCRVGQAANLDHFSASWNMNTKMIVSKNAPYHQKLLARINLHASMNHRDRALYHAYREMDHIGKSILMLPDQVMYIAKSKYRVFNDAVLTRAAVRVGIKANCVFQACRETKNPRTTKEVADAFGIPQRDISRTFDMYQEHVPEAKVHMIQSSDLIARLFNKITCIPEEHRGRAIMRTKRSCDEYTAYDELMGRTPKAIACAAIYVVLREMGYAIEKSAVCAICEVSVPTLSKIEAIIKAKA